MWEISWLPKYWELSKNKKRYCCACQFQDRFDLILSNQVKFDLKKLVCLYNETLIALVEIKKLAKSIMEEDIFYIFNNEKIYLEDMINFLFYLWMKSKNPEAFILLILIINSLFSRQSAFFLYTFGVIFVFKEKSRLR